MVLEVALVDELVTGRIVLELELELEIEVMEMTDEFETDDVVLEVELELVELPLELVTGRTTLELDVRLELESVEIVDELEMGSGMLLERDLLLDPEAELLLALVISAGLEAVVLPCELEGTPGVADEGGGDPETLAGAEGLVTGRVEGRVEGLVAGRVEELVGTAGRKITTPKVPPRSTSRLCASNCVKMLQTELLLSKERATQVV
jgi:hypothetical protein